MAEIVNKRACDAARPRVHGHDLPHTKHSFEEIAECLWIILAIKFDSHDGPGQHQTVTKKDRQYQCQMQSQMPMRAYQIPIKIPSTTKAFDTPGNDATTPSMMS